MHTRGCATDPQGSGKKREEKKAQHRVPTHRPFFRSLPAEEFAACSSDFARFQGVSIYSVMPRGTCWEGWHGARRERIEIRGRRATKPTLSTSSARRGAPLDGSRSDTSARPCAPATRRCRINQHALHPAPEEKRACSRSLRAAATIERSFSAAIPSSLTQRLAKHPNPQSGLRKIRSGLQNCNAS